MKLIKYSLIAAVGAFLLPAPPPDSFAVMQGGTRINLETGEVLGAAASTYADMSGFCERQPGVCQTAGQIFASLEVRAKYNFQRLYEWSTSNNRPSTAAGDIPQLPPLIIKTDQSAQLAPVPERGKSKPVKGSIVTGSITTRQTRQMAQAIKKPSVNTLQIEDLVPEWRGPVRTSTG